MSEDTAPMQQRLSMHFPDHAHFEGAVFIDTVRWSGQWTHDNEREAVERAWILLTNPDREVQVVIAGMAYASTMIFADLLAQGVQLGEPCTDPTCPVHGTHKPDGTRNLDGAFGMENYNLEEGI